MKIFWHQGSVVIEPDSKEEVSALMTLWESLIVKQGPSGSLNGEGSTPPRGPIVDSQDNLVAG